MNFSIAVKRDGFDSSYRAFAQVWCSYWGGNEEIPVAWISGLVEVQNREGCFTDDCHYTEMKLDVRWLELANATPPLTLKSMTLDEIKTYITLRKSDTIEVIADDKLRLGDEGRLQSLQREEEG